MQLVAALADAARVERGQGLESQAYLLAINILEAGEAVER